MQYFPENREDWLKIENLLAKAEIYSLQLMSIRTATLLAALWRWLDS